MEVEIRTNEDGLVLRSNDVTPGTILQTPDAEKQDSLKEENDFDPFAGEQTWPYEEEMAEGDGKGKSVSYFVNRL